MKFFLTLLLFTSLFFLSHEVLAKEMPIVCGHRGDSHSFPENTLPAFKNCLDNGIPAIELDVHQCKSGQIVVIHDDTVDRTTNGHGCVKDLDWDYLHGLNIKSSFIKPGQIVKLPLLKEVLTLVNGQMTINIEIKGYTPDLVKGVIELLHDYPKTAKIIISSFEYESLEEAYRLDKSLKLAYLTEKSQFLDVTDKLKKINACAWNPDFKSLTSNDVKLAHQNNYKIWSWTIDGSDNYKRACLFNIDGIITNEPLKLVKYLNSQ